MGKDKYQALYRELNASRFDSEIADAMVSELGPPAQVIRALALAGRHRWSSARTDLQGALASPGVAPLVEFLAGLALYVTRDYGLAVAALDRGAAGAKPGLAKQAKVYGFQLADRLGWFDDARRFAANPAQTDAQTVSEALRHGGPQAAIELLDARLVDNPEQPKVIAARLRIDLMLGRFDAAEARLASLRPAVREQLGAERAALALQRGDHDAVLARTVHAQRSPRLLYLRARALLRRGEAREAAELLERARVESPRSVAINLALSLARHQESPTSFDEALARRFEDLLAWAPALLSDAAAVIGVELWTDIGSVVDRPTQVAILTQADALLTAEADLDRVSYRVRTATGESRIRQILSTDPGAPQAFDQLHGDDRPLLDFVSRTLVQALGINPPRPEVSDSPTHAAPTPSGPWTPQFLSAAQIEQFITDGFIVVPRAFDPELARAWREGANRRIRDEPERWVRGYDPDDETRSLRGYSPDDPQTWTWGRVDLGGDQTVVIEQFAPRAWATICDLLGGPDRIKTRTWTNYLIVNFCDNAHLGVDAPKPHWDSWHIDDPSPTTRLDRIVNGLIGITLMDDLLPASGNTWIAPDSVGRVARELAAHPEGVDFVSKRSRGITKRCERFHEVVGETGDILLMHPLMMHSSSPNRSGRIRWMGNPMVYLDAPLDPFRPVAEMSPVELAIHRALER